MQVFDENVVCAKCGYRLKGLSDPGICPDCGSKFNVSANVGVYKPRSTRARMSGTAVIVAITTAMFTVLFCPCTGFMWFAYHYGQGKVKMPVIITLITAGLMITCLIAVGTAAKEWWDVKKVMRGPED